MCVPTPRRSQNAQLNGVDDLRLLTAGDVKHIEPNVQCLAALLSPSTGIVDSHAYMFALRVRTVPCILKYGCGFIDKEATAALR